MRRQLERAAHVVECVEAWMVALNDRETDVFTCRMIDRKTWAETAQELAGKYSGLSKHTMQRLLDHALDKVYEAAA